MTFIGMERVKNKTDDETKPFGAFPEGRGSFRRGTYDQTNPFWGRTEKMIV